MISKLDLPACLCIIPLPINLQNAYSLHIDVCLQMENLPGHQAGLHKGLKSHRLCSLTMKKLAIKYDSTAGAAQ